MVGYFFIHVHNESSGVIGTGPANMVIDVCIGQQRSIFGADAPGNGHHLFHFRLDHRHVAG